MNLADMLSYADIHQLNRIANHYECRCNTNSKKELIQSILNTVGRRDVFERYVEGLAEEDIRFLNSLLFDEREAFSLEELLARAKISRYDAARPPAGTAGIGGTDAGNEILQAVSLDIEKRTEPKKGKKKQSVQQAEPQSWSPRETVIKFTQQGWLFNGYSNHTKFLFQVPSDLKRRFGDALAKTFRRQLVYTEEPPVYRDEQGLLVEDVGRFLGFLRNREVELTGDGAMYKRSQMSIMELLHVKEELVGKGGWRFGYGRKIKDYPNRFSLIYDYCYYNGLLNEREGLLELTDDGNRFVSEKRVPDPRDVYQFWLKLYKNPIHNIQSLVHWIDRLADRWVALDSLSEVLPRLIKPYYYDTPDSILRGRIVQMMMHQGLLRIGEHPEAGPVIQMTKIGSSIIRGVYVPEEEKIRLPEQEPHELPRL